MRKHSNTGLPREKETWAIRGIEQDTRTGATMAARRAGMTVGQWCNRALRDAVTAAMKAPATPAKLLEETMAELVRQMQADREERQRDRDELAGRIAAMEARREAVPVSPANGGGNAFTRLYGLLRGKQAAS